jgi:perosamine synthetase
MFGNKEFESVKELLKSGNLCGWWKNPNGGPYLQEFEKKFAEFIGVNHAIAVTNGSSAIYVSLKACDVGEGDSVAVCPYTHVGSVAPIRLAGGLPLYVDCDDYGNIDPKQLSEEKSNIKAVIAAHQLGQPCEMEKISHEAGFQYVIEDCSQALGAMYKKKKVGSIGDIGCYSIGGDMTKTISIGEGGMIVTNDDKLVEKCRNIRNHGERDGADYQCFNFRISDLQASVGLLQMDNLQDQIDWQIENAKYLIKKLPDCLEFPEPPKYTSPAYYILGCNYQIPKTGMTRDQFLNKVKEKGFDGGLPRKNVGSGYSKLVSDIPFYKDAGKGFPKAEKKRDNSVWIDWHRYPRTKEEIDKLLDALKEIVNGG